MLSLVSLEGRRGFLFLRQETSTVLSEIWEGDTTRWSAQVYGVDTGISAFAMIQQESLLIRLVAMPENGQTLPTTAETKYTVF
jgi:hypothetical protein